MKGSLPSVTIVIATYNSSRTLSLCLERVAAQTYPKEKVDIVIADGGSTDSTREVARRFGAKVVAVNRNKQNAEYNKGVGLSHARGDIVLFLDHDNIMPHARWLRDLVGPFLKEPGIVAVEPIRFHYDRSMTLLDRYFALTGGSDPIVYYLGKNSHLSWAATSYNLAGSATDKGKYYLVRFTKENLPALGGNGAAFRRKLLADHALADPDHFIHTDVVYDLVAGGFGDYAFIKDSIIHLTNNRLVPFLKRRKAFIDQYQFRNRDIRRYLVYDPKTDTGKLLRVLVICLTLVVPFADAIRGYRAVPDPAWFLHPVLAFAYTIIYGWAVLERNVRHVFMEK